MNKSLMEFCPESKDALSPAPEILLLLKTADKYQRSGCRISRTLDFDSPALVLGFGELPCGISNRHMRLLPYNCIRLFDLAASQLLEFSFQPSKA